MNAALPFVGRRKEVVRLRQLHAQRKHVLILGPAGVGKTALIQHVAGLLSLLVCPQSERFTDICDALESQLGLASTSERLPQRKQRLRRALVQTGQTVVFDGVGWTTPKLSSFFAGLDERVPLWLASRSSRAGDVGHFWLYLSAFERVELQPFHSAETRALVEAAVAAEQVPAAALDAVEQLHHLSRGMPQVLCELLDGLAAGHYDLHRLFALKLLDLDRRIQHLELIRK